MKARLVLSEMTREQIQQVAGETTAVLPTGSTEQHGPHLPVQTDTYICEAICRLAAERASAEIAVTVAPTAVFGISHHHLPKPGVLSLSPSTFIQMVREVCEGLIRSGFPRIAIVNGHGGNDEAVRLLARDLANSHPVAVAATSYWTVARQSLLDAASAVGISMVPGHAGGFETSLIQALRPDLLDGRLPPPADPPTPELPLPATIARAGKRIGDGPGYTDDPSAASPEHGRRFLELAARDLASFLVQFHRS